MILSGDQVGKIVQRATIGKRLLSQEGAKYLTQMPQNNYFSF